MSIKKINIKDLAPHPDNRPLGVNEEKVNQLSEMMTANGYDESKPLKVRPLSSGFQIIEGEHRWRACQIAGIESIPCFVVDLDDDEALIQLVAGNVQTESHALDFGYAALKLCQKASKKGFSVSAFAKRLGVHENTLKRSRKAAEVRIHIEQSTSAGRLLDSVAILEEISRCKESDWAWLHDLMLTNQSTHRDAIEISKRVRQVDDVAGEYAESVFDVTKLKQDFVIEKERVFVLQIELLSAIEECATKLSEDVELYEYVSTSKTIEAFTYTPQRHFLDELSSMSNLSRPDVFKVYKKEADYVRTMTHQKALEDKEYYEAVENKQAAEDRARAEWEAFTPKLGTWYELGNHRLYCGDNRDKAFINGLPDNSRLAFADPPYNADVDEWDSNFEWSQDYLSKKADFVVVTPGISAIQDFMKRTEMPYKWSLSAWISNGMTRGALGFGNWIYAALFSVKDSVHLNAQDFQKINIKTSESENHYHRGKKPNEYMDWILSLFAKEGDVVIDPFLGSGTTLLRCDSLGMTCIAAEKDPVSCKRIMEQYKNIV